MTISRRHFFERIIAAGGATLAYDSMTALGLIAQVAPAPFDLRGRVNGVRVVVLGAGLAGLTAAYELAKLGYTCQVLEARPRPGGRAHTVRRGTGSEEDGSIQTCDFDEGLYFNPGAMRIPHHHSTVLNYCRELNVALEVFAVSGDSDYLYQQKAPALAGRRIRRREARADLDGYVAELLSKALSQDELDASLTKDDRERLLEHLRATGALDEQRLYRGSPDRGPADGPGPGSSPLALRDLLGSGVGGYLDAGYQYQPTMLQVVGGTDRLPAAFAAKLRDKIIYRAAVGEIRQSDRGISVAYAEPGGRLRKVEADYCVCTIPLPILAGLDTDLATDFRKAVLGASTYAAAGKIGLQFKRRFWEEDDFIYGGTTRTDQEIAQIIYPSHGFHTRKGVLIGYYVQGQLARPVGERSPADRLALALEQGGRIHPQYATEFENSFSVAWHRTTWNKGSWLAFTAEVRERLPLLMQPERRFYLCGDHLNMNAWMQGAFESARQVATLIHARAMQDRPRAVA